MPDDEQIHEQMDERMDEQMDQRLRSYGDRWRAGLPEPAPVAAGTRRRAGLLVAAAAAAVLVVVGVGVALRTGADRTTAPPADATTSSPAAGVVPWAALPPTHPTLPTAPAPACGPGDVELGEPQPEGAAGTEYLSVDLRLTGDVPCWVDETPTLTFLSGGQQLDLPVTQDDQPDSTPGSRVLVDGSHPTTLTVGWAVSHSCPAVDNDEIDVTLAPGDIELTLAGFGRSSCNPGEQRSLPFVLPIQTTGVPDARISSWTGVDVTGDLDVTADSGEPIAFEVTVTSPVDLPLQACPDYVLTVGGNSSTHGLNCAAVPYVDDAGTPYLPAGTPVTFALQADASDQATGGRLTWRLDTPGARRLSGTVTIGDVALGTVTGTVTVVGGPAGTPDQVVTAGTVTATGPAGPDHAVEATIGPDGSYTLQLPAGAYDLEATPVAPLRGITCPDRVGVTAGTTTTADITCSIR